MGRIIKTNQPCLNEECGSSDALRVYEDLTSYCFSCRTWFPPEAYNDTGASVESNKAKDLKVPRSRDERTTLDEVSEYTVRGFKDRGVTKAVCEFFGVRVSYDADGNIDAHYYPYVTDGQLGYKVRKLPKTFRWLGTPGELFGRDKFGPGGKRLIVTEGEVDALSVAQAHLDKYGKVYPVVSLHSAGGVEALLKHREWVRSFDEVILFLDNDKAGKEAFEKALKIVGVDKARVVTCPSDCKDANDILVKHGWRQLMETVWDAHPWSPSGIVSKDDLWAQLTAYNAVQSVPYAPCLRGVNSKVKGHRPGEIALFISGTGCFQKDTTVLMFDGSLKKVQDVVTGDMLMGPDNTPRTVKELFRGREAMAKITLRDSTSFVCNMSHVLSLVNNDGDGRWGLTKGEIVDVTVRDYLKWSTKRRHLSKAFKASMLEFPGGDTLEIPPYVLGVWLGDGYSDGARFACQDSDSVIIDEIRKYGYDVYKGAAPFMWNAPGRLRGELISLNLLENKHIPEKYLQASSADRLELLAGLMDTDGSYDTLRGGYEFSQKCGIMVQAVKRLAESLGFAVSVGRQQNNKFGNCYRVYISGDGIERIPCRLPRKQARPRLQKKDSHRYSFTVEELDEDDFYGFNVDGDNRFVLGNFVVTHNSGKSTLLREDMLHILETTKSKIGIVSLEESPAETARKLSGMAIYKNPAEEEVPLEELKVGFDKVFGDDRVILLDHQGSIKDDSIIDKLEYMALAGCEYLYIDHITILVSEGSDGLTGNEAQDKVMNDLLRLVKRHPIWIGLVSHLRKAQNGQKSFEEGRLPSLDDIRGSGSIKQIAFDIIAFARNLTAESERERNTIKMAVLKSRYTGLTGAVQGAFYKHSTGRLEALTDEAFDLLPKEQDAY